jgi:hypothetical protein
VEKKNKHKLAVAVADADTDAEVVLLLKLKDKREVDVVDVARVNLVAALESTLADIAGEFLVDYGR